MGKINFYRRDIKYPKIEDFLSGGFLYNEKFDFSHTNLPKILLLHAFNYLFLSYYEEYPYVVARFKIYSDIKNLKFYILTKIFCFNIEDNEKEFIFKGHLFSCQNVNYKLIEHYFGKRYLI